MVHRSISDTRLGICDGDDYVCCSRRPFCVLLRCRQRSNRWIEGWIFNFPQYGVEIIWADSNAVEVWDNFACEGRRRRALVSEEN